MCVALFQSCVNRHRAEKNLNCLMDMFPAKASYGKQMFFSDLQPHFLYSCAFFWWFHCLKWPTNVALKCCLMFLRTRRLWRALWGKYVCQISVFQAWVTVLLAAGSKLMNQQYILNKVSLNRNTHKIRLCIDQWMKMRSEGSKNLTLYFHRGNDLVCIDSVIAVAL